MAAYILDHFPEMELLDALPKESMADISYNGILPGKPEWVVKDGAPRDELKRTPGKILFHLGFLHCRDFPPRMYLPPFSRKAL
mgnify:CR=1 FL=1